MSSANCPTCGGPIEFKIASSFLVVCSYCKSAIARTDRDLKDMGKVADLVETDSPLSIGMAGKYFNTSFRLTGRSQLRHQLGGVWDEWYAAFSDGRWGWLAEAQGRFFMTFASPLPNPPSYEELTVGEAAPNMPVPLVVTELGTAHYTSAEGEIPFALEPGEAVRYADLSGDAGLFATLDASGGTPIFYAGREVTLQDLSVNTSGAEARKQIRAKITNLGCPNCGGSLALRAPDETERVGCPSCGSLLDCTHGKFEVLQTLKSKLEKPLLPLGAQAEFEGAKQTVIGFLKRSCIVHTETYFWNEYLLYSKERGFRWLVHSDHHWTYVKNIPTAGIKLFEKYATYNGKSFQRFQDAPAQVELVIGEFYWKVTVGETVRTSDFIRPPQMLSCEVMSYEGGGAEVAWSLGEYIFPEEIETKFKLLPISKPNTVGACEPFKHTGYFWRWVALLAVSIALAIALEVIRPQHSVLKEEITLNPKGLQISSVPPPAPPAEIVESTAQDMGQIYLSKPFKLNAREFVNINASTKLYNEWLSLQCDLINEETGEVQPFSMMLESYHGVEDGESWSEGNGKANEYLAALPAGNYILRVEAFWEKKRPMTFTLEIGQGGMHGGHFVLVFFMISFVPIIVLIWRFMHHSGRWKQSMYGGGDE